MRIISLFARTGTQAYPYALRNFRHFFKRQFPMCHHEIIVADNAMPCGHQSRLDDAALLIGAPAHQREFSSWAWTLRQHADRILDQDLVILATSAFENEPNSYLRDFRPETLTIANNYNQAVGHIDSDGSSSKLEGQNVAQWLRTSLAVLKPDTLCKLGALDAMVDPDMIFSMDPDAPFLPDCGIGQELQDCILAWLCGRPSSFKGKWHSCFELTRFSMDLFVKKAVAILNERLFSARLQKFGCRLTDVSWLASALANGCDIATPPSPLAQTLENAGILWQNQPNTDRAEAISPDHAAIILKPALDTGTNAPSYCPNLEALFIDKRILTPDSDAGSLATFGFLQTYAEMGFNVTFAAHELCDKPVYKEQMEKADVRCVIPSRIEKEPDTPAREIVEHLQREGGKYAIIFIYRAQFAAIYYDLVKKYAPQAKIIFQTTDLHYLRLAREAKINNNPNLRQRAAETRKTELQLMRKADATIVVSDLERKFLEEEGVYRTVHTVPLIIVDPVWEIASFEERRDIMFVGGFSHRPNVDAMLYFCAEVLPLVRAELPELRLHIIGSNAPESIKRLQSCPGVKVHGFVRDISAVFNSCRLSIAPLRYGAGIKGKIGQSLAFGVPVVSTPIGAEGLPPGEGSGVLVAASARKFAQALVGIYCDKALWQKESRAALSTAYDTYSPERAKLRQMEFLDLIGLKTPRFVTWRLRSKVEHERFKKLLAADFGHRHAVEKEIAKTAGDCFAIKGLCGVCGRPTQFQIQADGPERNDDGSLKKINWRETLACPHCQMNNRMRLALHYFYSRLQPRKDAFIYLTENITIMYDLLKRRHPFVMGSEYLEDRVPPGSIWDGMPRRKGIRNEDMTCLTFPDNSFDFVLSFDVLEHVMDDLAAFREVLRVLRPGGIFLFTCPFINSRDSKLVRAEIAANGEIVHHLPPEIHGNPLNRSQGSLAFRVFAWDMFNDLRTCGFADAWAESVWSREFGYLGNEQYLFVAKKGALHGK